MAQQHRNAFKVGIVTIVVVVMFVTLLLWISKGVGGKMQQIVIHFKPSPSMPTLGEGSMVLVGGQKVGKVLKAELIKDPTPTTAPQDAVPSYIVVAEVEIQSFVQLHEDCSAVAEGPPLGGDGIIKIDLGKSDKRFTGAFLQGSEPGGFAAILASLQGEFDANDPTSLLGRVKIQLDPDTEMTLMAKLHQTLTDINVITTKLASEMSPADRSTLLAQLHQVVDNVQEATATLRRQFDDTQPDRIIGKVRSAIDQVNDGLTSVVRIVQSSEQPVQATLANVQKTSENIANETDGARADSLMSDFKAAGQKLTAALDDIKTTTGTTREVIVLNRENINRMLTNFKEASDHIKTGVKYVLLHPWRLLNAPSPKEMQQQAIFDAARNFAEAATRIDDATGQLRALAELHGGTIPTDDPNLARIQESLKQTQEQYQKAEAEFWRQLNTN